MDEPDVVSTPRKLSRRRSISPDDDLVVHFQGAGDFVRPFPAFAAPDLIDRMKTDEMQVHIPMTEDSDDLPRVFETADKDLRVEVTTLQNKISGLQQVIQTLRNGQRDQHVEDRVEREQLEADLVEARKEREATAHENEKLKYEIEKLQTGAATLDWTFEDNEAILSDSSQQAEKENFINSQSEFTDKTLRTSLLEKIYDMARSSDTFRVELVDNLIILLKFKEMTIPESADKKALQVSIDKLSDVRSDMQNKLTADIDDMETRISECFAGIAEFNEFRNYFKEELEEIKRLNEVADVSSTGQFTPKQASSPMKAGAPRSVLRQSSIRSRNSIRSVRFERQLDELNRSRRSESSLSQPTPERDCCVDCARYRALLRSFRTTQEADRQKQQEQLKTIEKLASAITSSTSNKRTEVITTSKSYSVSRHTRGKSENGMDEPDFLFAPRKLFDDNSLSDDTSDSVQFRGTGDFMRPRPSLAAPDLIDRMKSDQTPEILPMAKDFGEQVMLSGDTEKDLRVEVTSLQNKISGLEQNLRNAKQDGARSSAKDVKEADAVAAELHEVKQEYETKVQEVERLRQENDKLKAASAALDVTCEDVVAMSEESRRQLEEQTLAFNQLRDEMEKLKTLESANTTAELYTRSPSPKQPPLSYDKLWKDHQGLTNDFEEMYANAEALLKEKEQLQEELIRLKNQLRQPPVAPKPDARIPALQRELEEVKENRKELECEISQRRNEQAVVKDENRRLRAEVERLGRDLGLLSRDCAAKEMQREDLKVQLRKMGAELDNLHAQQQILPSHSEEVERTVRLQEQVHRLEERVFELEDENLELHGRVQERINATVSDVPNRDKEILQDRLNIALYDFGALQEKYDILAEDMRNYRQTAEEFARENRVFERELKEERTKSQDTERFRAECAALRKLLDEKEQEIAQLQSDVNDKHLRLIQAQAMFDKDNKSLFAKLRAPFSKKHHHVSVTKINTPRRSATFTPVDVSKKSTSEHNGTSRNAGIAKQNGTSKVVTIREQETKRGMGPSGDGVRNGITNSTSYCKRTETVVTTKPAVSPLHASTMPRAANVTPKLPSSSTLPLPKKSPAVAQRTVAKPVSSVTLREPLAEPYAPPSHPHVMKEFFNFRSQKCNVCLGNLPYFSNGIKCSECRHVYHIRCAQQVQLPAICDDAVKLDREEVQQRPSLGSAGIDDMITEPVVSGYLRVKRRDEDLPQVWAELLGDKIFLYAVKPWSLEGRESPVEVIDLNEQRRHAQIVCHRTVGPSEWNVPLHELVFAFAVETKYSGSAVPSTKICFLGKDVVEKFTWTSAIESLLTANEVDTADASLRQLDGRTCLSVPSELSVSSALFYDQNQILIGAHNGLYIADVSSKSGLGLVPGFENRPVMQLGMVESAKEILVLSVMDEERCFVERIRKQDLIMRDERRLRQDKLPLLTDKECHLFEVLGDYVALAAGAEVLVYRFKGPNAQRATNGYSLTATLLISPDKPDYGLPIRSLNLFPGTNSVRVVAGVYYFHEFEVSSTRSTVKPKVFPLPPSNLDGNDYYWTSEDRVKAGFEEASVALYAMGMFALPSVEAHQKIGVKGSREYLLCFYDGGVFINGRGEPTGVRDLDWKHIPRMIQYHDGHLYIVHYNSIQVRRIMKQDAHYCASPAFFYEIRDPWPIGVDRFSSHLVITANDSRNARVDIRQIKAEITDADIEERRRMPRDDDTESASSLAFTDPL